MSITPSVSSARPLLSPPSISNKQGQRTPGISPSTYTFSKSLPSANLPSEGLNLNPDELFTKYAVSEVKAVQHRLRSIPLFQSVTMDDFILCVERMPMQSRRNFGLWLGAHFLVMRDCCTILNEVESAENAIAIYCKPPLLSFLLPSRRGTYAKLWKNVET